MEILVNVLAVVGIIVVGGFVVVFLSNILLNVLDSSNKDRAEHKAQEQYYNQEQLTYFGEQQPMQQALLENRSQENYDEVDFDKASQEELSLGPTVQENKEVEDAYAKLREEEAAFRLERQKFIQEKQAEKEAAQETASKESEEQFNFADDEDDDINLDDIFFDEDEEIVDENPVKEPEENFEFPHEEEVEEEIEEQPIEEELELPEEEEEVEEETPSISDEQLKELQAQLAKQAAELEEYKKRAEEAENKLAATPVAAEPVGSLEEYEARLETLTERLKVAEKEFKKVKKEYMPLAKVRNRLQNDKTKLRRREALVAKQKVMLYGVNNIGEIDEEKAKKLAEDLDLLDGLKVSVEHCEEVIKQNEERLPILENTYNILLESREQLKADIAECQAKIEELKNADNND